MRVLAVLLIFCLAGCYEGQAYFGMPDYNQETPGGVRLKTNGYSIPDFEDIDRWYMVHGDAVVFVNGGCASISSN